jgi:hypothetical protein
MANASYVWSGSAWVPIASSFPAAHQRGIVSTASATYTLGVSDVGKAIEFTNSDAVTVTVPADSAYSFAIGQTILLIQKGTGTVSVTGDSGVTLSGAGVTDPVEVSAQYGVATLLKLDEDDWIIFGDLA